MNRLQKLCIIFLYLAPTLVLAQTLPTGDYYNLSAGYSNKASLQLGKITAAPVFLCNYKPNASSPLVPKTKDNGIVMPGLNEESICGGDNFCFSYLPTDLLKQNTTYNLWSVIIPPCSGDIKPGVVFDVHTSTAPAAAENYYYCYDESKVTAEGHSKITLDILSSSNGKITTICQHTKA